MSYYKGDYYRGHGRGDYYRGRRGDPFWGGLWTVIKGVGSALLGAPRPAAPQQPMYSSNFAPYGWQGQLPPAQQPGPEAYRIPLGVPPFPPSPMRRPTGAMGPLNLRVDPMTGQPVAYRRRRMNPSNPRALRRSIRRVVGFGRLASRSKRAIGKAASALGVNRGRSRRSSWPPRRKAS